MSRSYHLRKMMLRSLGRLAAPCGPGGVGGIDGGLGILGAQVGRVGQLQVGGRVVHGEAAGACRPLAVDQAFGLEQAGVFEGRGVDMGASLRGKRVKGKYKARRRVSRRRSLPWV